MYLKCTIVLNLRVLYNVKRHQIMQTPFKCYEWNERFYARFSGKYSVCPAPLGRVADKLTMETNISAIG